MRVVVMLMRPPLRRSAALPAHAQQGQALVLGLVLAGTVALAFVRYFDAGMAVAEKARQDHVLDAAAYSGALVQARAFNMLAYLQRTQLAHQVAMAHLVTLGSWAHFAGMEAGRASMGNPPAHVIAMHFGPEHAKAYLAATKANGLQHIADTHGSLSAAYAEHDRVSRSVLAYSAQQVVKGLSGHREQAMREVVAANYPQDPAFHITVSRDAVPGFIQAYAGNPRLRPFLHELTNLYRFLDPRDHLTRSRFPVSARCPAWRHELRRRGRTLLDEGGRWQSLDTQSYHALRSNRWVGCYFREYPMGWGWIPPRDAVLIDVPHVEDPPQNFADQNFWRWVRESTSWDIFGGNANPLANSWAHSDRKQWPGGGIPAFHDLSDPGGEAVASFHVSLRRQGSGGLEYRSHSAAETYFRRPYERSDGRHELPNLFHPYWQARLRTSGRQRNQPYPLPRSNHQSGQALFEALLSVLVLGVLWAAVNALAHYQDIALSAVHASRHAAFIGTRVPSVHDAHRPAASGVVQRFFTGRAHRWNDLQGRPVLTPDSVHLDWRRLQPLSQSAQPGGSVPFVDTLRHEWRVHDSGHLRATTSLHANDLAFGLLSYDPAAKRRYVGLFPGLQRSTSILTGAGHSASDALAQSVVAGSEMAWSRAYAAARAAGSEVANRAAGVDSGWVRADPIFDWLGPWSGRVPGHLVLERHGG